MKHIAIVNAGPRKGWNTDTLLHEAEAGAARRNLPERERGSASIKRETI